MVLNSAPQPEAHEDVADWKCLLWPSSKTDGFHVRKYLFRNSGRQNDHTQKQLPPTCCAAKPSAAPYSSSTRRLHRRRSARQQVTFFPIFSFWRWGWFKVREGMLLFRSCDIWPLDNVFSFQTFYLIFEFANQPIQSLTCRIYIRKELEGLLHP